MDLSVRSRVTGQKQAGVQAGSTVAKETAMTISTLAITPLISLVAGVLILVMPRLLNYIVAIYLIAVGIIGLFPQILN